MPKPAEPAVPSTIPAKPCSGDLADLLLPDEWRAVQVLRSHGFDPARTYQLWESLTARFLDGALTAAKAPYDVAFGAERVEVKFSSEHWQRGYGAERRVFRWVGINSTPSRVTVCWGLDELDQVYAWVAPSRLLGASITVISPRDRVRGDRTQLMLWSVPPDQILPAVMSAAEWRPDR